MFESFKPSFLNIVKENPSKKLMNLHLFIFNEISHINFIKRNLRKFKGLKENDLNRKSVEIYLQRNLSQEQIDDVYGLLETEAINDISKEEKVELYIPFRRNPTRTASQQSIVSRGSRSSRV